MIKSQQMKRWTILIFLFTSFCFAGGSHYKVTGIADDDTLSVRQSTSASSKKTGSLLPYDTGITIGKCKKNGSTTWCKIDFLSDDTMILLWV